MNEQLKQQLDRLPAEPGVYVMRDADGAPLYVGKAIDLRSRVRSYFQLGRTHQWRTDAVVERVANVETIIVKNEVEALLLECNLIKQLKPPYNVRLKDDKKYPYLKVTVNEPFPRVIFTRKVIKDGGRYYGPFTDAAGLREVIDLIRRAFPLRTCTYEDIGEKYHRPCLQYHIKRCMAPCAFLQTKADYNAIVSDALLFLEGRHGVLIDRLEREMREASEQMAYEHAGRLRNKIADLKRVMERQEVVWRSQIDMDLIAGAHGQGISSLEVFLVRAGKLIGQEHYLVEGTQGRSPADILSEFVKLYYTQTSRIPKEIMIELEIEDRAEIERALTALRGSRARILVPARGARAEYMRKVRRNAEKYLTDHLIKATVAQERANAALAELAAVLNLPALPQRIEAYDISHVHGTNVVGSMVAFEDARPQKSDYRRFKIQGAPKNDDYANMAQMLRRRLRYLQPRESKNVAAGLAPADGKDKKFSKRPNLLLIDGGRGQLGAAIEGLREFDLVAIPVAALAKQFEELYLPGEAEPVVLARNSPALHLVQHIRDEAHRFAVTYHRLRRSKTQTVSALDDLRGIGPARKSALLRSLGSVAAVRSASIAELRAVPGISEALARSIHGALNKDGQPS